MGMTTVTGSTEGHPDQTGQKISKSISHNLDEALIPVL
jgi:hypothetical protein